ncbi:MAG: metallophosphoesterase family protein [Anaerolineae bacterium]|nr:metallophosphatase family protein [Thermoflexus sp.]MDW8064185.1 metallophosphoesterase family protein [Anaerolineae bacterium]
MRILVLSDIHGNLEALEAVLADAGTWDALWFLGDLVGYGPDPVECIDRIQRLAAIALAGNHDLGVIGRVPLAVFSSAAREVLEWTRGQLPRRHVEYLMSLSVQTEHDGITLVHGSLRAPIWEYVLDPCTAWENIERMSNRIALFGHTHVGIAYHVPDRGALRMHILRPVYDEPIDLRTGWWLLNPGSVGQPRDGDPRAAYAILDLKEMTWMFRRVPYPIAETQAKMHRLGFPSFLIERLAYGE